MSGSLRILAGPPPEYNMPPPTALNEVTPNVIMIQTEHSSPSTPSVALEGGPSSLTDSLDDHRRTKKVDAPLPQIPQLVVAEGNPLNDQGEDGTDESPYDYAKFDREEQHERRVEDVRDVNENRKLPGSYAKVSRHPESNQDVANYAEVRQFNSFESRVRSATDPVEPSRSLSPFHSRTFTGVEGAANLPLPLPPRDFDQEEDKYDDTYDSIEDLRAAAEALLKPNNSLDDENDEMYESVPEDFKEELGILTSPAPLLPLRNLELTSNTASSPTKVPNLGSPDSPTAKLFKKSTKESKRKNRTESASSEDEHKHRTFIFNRFRSASASVGIRKDNKKDHEMFSLSPDHSLPLPPIPHPPSHPYPRPHLNEDEENGTYDSVQDNVAKTLSLPQGIRMSTFSSRVNEPLPEVPEDSGSGGTAFVVKRDRLIEASDPNYDTVNSAMLGSPVAIQNDSEFDPDYDTVNHKQQNSPPLPHSGHGYATVSSHDLPIEGHVEHDDKGYALLDQEIVQRKRAASLTKSSVDNPVEPPYDRVKQKESDSKSSDDPGYASIKQVLGTLSETENVPSPEDSVQNGQEPKPGHSYAKVTSHSSMDDKEPYATIDPEIIQRKRAESQSKSSSSQPQESPYNRVKDLQPATELVPNEPVNKYNKPRELCDQTEHLTVSDPETNETSLQHQDNDIIGQVEIKIEDRLSDDEEDKYSRVDLIKKHQNKKQMMEDPLDVHENIPPSSPVPPLPPIGDLGDMSEFEPPPVPTQRLDVHDDNTSELSHNEDETADTEPPYAKVTLTSKTEDTPPINSQCEIMKKVIPHDKGKVISSQEQTPNNVIPSLSRSLHSSTSSEGVPVYDSLECQHPMYDSLDPMKGGPLYDSLEAVPGKEDNLNHIDNLNVDV